MFEELKRRNVFRVGLAYIMLGWVVVQVTDVVVPALNLPEVLNAIVVYIGLIGFPFALFFAWAFELTPDGVKRSEEVDVDESKTKKTGRQLERIALGLLAVAVVLLALDRFSGDSSDDASVSTAELSKSIAVLPFVNMSTDPEQEFFSDGISEEILNVLAKIPELHVTSRSSAFAFKGTQINIPDVAQQLGVSTVLEGSVRKAGTRVRITAQLIQADGDKHLWSETYDRELDDIFAIQDEISQAIVVQLRTHLGLSETVEVASQLGMSQNTEAYEFYLKGRQLLLQRTNESINAAVRNLEYALSLDPDFALAHAELAVAHMLLTEGQYGSAPFQEVQERARPHAERALTLAPEHPDVLSAYGFIEWNFFAPPLTIDYFQRALEKNPNHATLLNWLAIIEEERGNSKEALELRLKLMALDPLGAANLANLGSAYRYAFSQEEFDALLEKLKSLSPSAYLQAVAGELSFKGQIVEATKANFEAVLDDPNSGILKQRAGFNMAGIGLWDEAINLNPSNTDTYLLQKGDFRGVIDYYEGLDRELFEYETRMLGRAYAALGDYESALPLMEEVWQSSGNIISAFSFGQIFGTYDAIAFAAAKRQSDPDADISDIRQSIESAIKRNTEGSNQLQFIEWLKAALAVIDGDFNSSVEHYRASLQAVPISINRETDFYAELYAQEGFMELLDQTDAVIKMHRDRFLGDICAENPYESFWNPLPETCVGYN